MSKIAGWIFSALIAALLLGPSAGSKLTEAESLGVTVLSEADLTALLQP